jgi:hypothetical protein
MNATDLAAPAHGAEAVTSSVVPAPATADRPANGRTRFAGPVLTAALAVLCGLTALAVYDRQVVRPGQRLGIVDVGEVYRQSEAEFTRMVTEAGSANTPQADQARAQALAMAQQFARRLPAALQELAQDCGCLVLLRSAVAGAPAHAQDLTALLRQKLERP